MAEALITLELQNPIFCAEDRGGLAQSTRRVAEGAIEGTGDRRLTPSGKNRDGLDSTTGKVFTAAMQHQSLSSHLLYLVSPLTAHLWPINPIGYSLPTSLFAMNSIDMDAINFYEGPPNKAYSGERAAVTSCDTLDNGGQSGNRLAARSHGTWSGKFNNYDLVEVLDFTDPSPKQPCLLLSVRTVRNGKSVASFALSPFRLLNKLLTMLRPADGFLADDLHDFAVSVVNDDVRSLNELLSNATEAQASQKTGTHSMVQSDANRDRLEEYPGDEIGGPRRRTNSSKGRWICFPCVP